MLKPTGQVGPPSPCSPDSARPLVSRNKMNSNGGKTQYQPLTSSTSACIHAPMCTHMYTRERKTRREIEKHRERCRETNPQTVRETKREGEIASFYVEARKQLDKESSNILSKIAGTLVKKMFLSISQSLSAGYTYYIYFTE